MVRLGKHDPMDDRVQTTIPTTVQAMTNQPSRRGLEGRHAGVRRQLRVVGEATAWPQSAGQHPSGEKVDSTEPGKRREPGLGACPDAFRQLIELGNGQRQAAS